jgi:hypothetical protein
MATERPYSQCPERISFLGTLCPHSLYYTHNPTIRMSHLIDHYCLHQLQHHLNPCFVVDQHRTCGAWWSFLLRDIAVRQFVSSSVRQFVSSSVRQYVSPLPAKSFHAWSFTM